MNSICFYQFRTVLCTIETVDLVLGIPKVALELIVVDPTEDCERYVRFR